jgi:hypothetical protein
MIRNNTQAGPERGAFLLERDLVESRKPGELVE